MSAVSETVATSVASWDDTPSVAQDVAAVRAQNPLTHCLTNFVAAPLNANLLLAAGASPAMASAYEEVREFARIAAGLLVNTGTVVTESRNTWLAGAEAASAADTPWVLDPIAAGAGIAFRDRLAADLLALGPTIIRGNASEILGVAGEVGGGKGTDSTVDSADAVPVARELARRSGAVVAISGVVDYVTDGEQVVAIPGGHEWMTRVTGVGCSLGALIAGFAGPAPTPLRAAVAASVLLGEAGKRAAAEARAPGAFAVALVDQVHLLSSSREEVGSR